MKTTCFFFLIFLSGTLVAQTITGQVKDADSKKPLPFTNVYINNSSIGTTSDENGHFRIENAPSGSIQVITSYVGYVTDKQFIFTQNNEVYDIEVKLMPDQKFLDEIEVVSSRRDTEWDSWYDKFERNFLGETANAKYCKITNPEVIDVFSKGDTLYAVAKAPVEIENRALGYRIFFEMKEFAITDGSYNVVGYSFFEELEEEKGNDRRRWDNVRKRTFERSVQHIFFSILNNSAKKDGYELYKTLQSAAHLAKNEWFYNQELGKRVVVLNEDQLGKRQDGEIIYLELPPMIEIHFNRISTRKRAYRDVPFEVAWIMPNKQEIALTANGELVDPSSISVGGYLATLRVADLLPIDYSP